MGYNEMKNISYSQLKEQVSLFKPHDLIDMLDFNKSLELALNMLNNEEWEESLQTYGVNLLEEMREKYHEKWNSSWKYDALLGYAYDITLKYDERYMAYKRALDKISPPPSSIVNCVSWVLHSPRETSH